MLGQVPHFGQWAGAPSLMRLDFRCSVIVFLASDTGPHLSFEATLRAPQLRRLGRSLTPAAGWRLLFKIQLERLRPGETFGANLF